MCSSLDSLQDEQACEILGTVTEDDELLLDDLIAQNGCLVVNLRTKKIKTGSIIAASVFTDDWYYDLWS
jgi:hypothetical protein